MNKRRGPRPSVHTEQVLVRLSPETKAALEVVAAREQRPLGVVLRRFAEKALARVVARAAEAQPGKAA